MKNILEAVAVFAGRIIYLLVLVPFFHEIDEVEWWTAVILSVITMSFFSYLRRISETCAEMVRQQHEIAAEVREMRRECTRMSIDIKEINETIQYQWEERKTN